MEKDKDRWIELAELAANEQDSVKMLKIVRELNDLLEKKQRRLEHLPKPEKSE